MVDKHFVDDFKEERRERDENTGDIADYVREQCKDVGKSTKVSDSAFGSFMDTHASKVSAVGASKEALSVSDKVNAANSKQLTAKNDMESKCADAKAAAR